MTPEEAAAANAEMAAIDASGGPAFPAESRVRFYLGMSLRDWFAGQALAGTCADPTSDKAFKNAEQLALFVYHLADAMLAERAKVKP